MLKKVPPKALSRFAQESPPKTGTPPDVSAEVRASFMEAFDSVIRRIEAIDLLLLDVSKLLDKFQPARTGKITIVFIPIDGLTRPRPVVWHWIKTEKLWGWDQAKVAALPLRAKTSHAFYENRKVVIELLRMAQKLMEMRANLLISITNFKQSSRTRLAGSTPHFDKFKPRVLELLVNKDAWPDFSKLAEHGD